MKAFNLIVILLLLTSVVVAKEKQEWDDGFTPGELVCIYDIGYGDPLIDNKSSRSLKYWYRSKLGAQQSRYELRPIARNLVLRVLYPGLKKDNDGWYSGTLLVVKGGQDNHANMPSIEMGDNKLLIFGDRTYVASWQLLYFEKARFKKDLLKGFGCKRHYPKY